MLDEVPSADVLADALESAAQMHHQYEQEYLEGDADQHWAGFYAAFVLGRLGDFTSPSRLARSLAEAPESDPWARAAAEHVLGAVDP